MPRGVKKAKKEETPQTNEDIFESQLTKAGLSSVLRYVDEEDVAYEVLSSGWPGVDTLVGGPRIDQRGIPRQVHIEVYSKVEHVGKTSFTLGIGVAWQKAGKRVAVIDIEPSTTPSYLRQVGFITSKEIAEKQGLYAVRLLQPKVKVDKDTTDMYYASQILNVVAAAANLFDLVIVDSVDALIEEAEALKTADENSGMAGIAKPLKRFIRSNTKRRATFLWVNHMSVGVGQYASNYTYGGKAIPRYSTIRFQLERVDYLRETKESDPFGFVTKVTTVKNRVSGPFRSTFLYYIFGEGFSIDYDYYNQAKKLGIITKNGGWFYVGTDKDNSKLTCQGDLAMYRYLKGENPNKSPEQNEAARLVFQWIKGLIDGEDVSVEELSEEEKLEAELAALDAEAEEPEEETVSQ